MENKINFGQLDTLVTVRSCQITTGAEGQKKFIFSDFRDVYAKVDLNVSEVISNTNLEEGEYIQLTIHKIPELSTRWQIVLKGRNYEITGIDPVSRVSPFCILTIHAIS
jgi:hypothetical protein